MGRKVNPIGFRLGITSTWESKWFAERNYTELLHEDIKIRRLIVRPSNAPAQSASRSRRFDDRRRTDERDPDLTRAGIARIEIERAANKVDITLFTSKPGIVIGKQGSTIERVRQRLEKEIGKKVHLKIEEIKVPETNARLIAESIAEQISRRVAYRRAMKHAVQQAIRRGAKGVKIRLSGRLGGAEMSRTVVEMDGRVPLHTLRADIDFATVHAPTTYGRIGVKVWVYNGEVLPQKRSAEQALAADLAAMPAD